MKNLIVLLVAFVSVQAFAQRVEIGRASKSFNVTSGTRIVNLNFNLPVYRYDYATRVVPSVCYRTECTVEVGNGTQGDWKGFFSVPKAEKAKALADAVKGIGKATAQKIVDNNLLTHKPDSWSLFVKEINKIENKLQKLGYQATFAQEVIDVYGYENRINLGYGSAESCTKEPYDCYITQVVEVETRLRDIPRSMQVTINGQTLQSFEKDVVSLTVGNENNDVTISSTGFNNYSGVVLNRGNSVDLTATRIKVVFPVTEVNVTAAKANTRQLQVNAIVPQKYFSEDVGATLSMEVEICKSGFLGLCSTQGTYLVEDVKTSVTRTYDVSKAGSYFARVRFFKRDSEYYNSNKSSQLTTNKVKL